MRITLPERCPIPLAPAWGACRLQQAMFVFGLLLLANIGVEARPQVIWASDPVRAGETVLVRGDGFEPDAQVEVASVSGNAKLKWRPAELLQQTPRTLKFVLPKNLGTGMFAYRIQTGGASSETRFLNSPQVWWMQGNETEMATSGGWLRLFGLNLTADAQTKVILRGAGANRTLAAVGVDEFAAKVNLPADLAPGDYDVVFQSGNKHPAGSCVAGTIRVAIPTPRPETIFDVTKFGAVPAEPTYLQYYTGMMLPGQVDSAEAIQKALDAAGQAGGGVVFFPRGVFVLSRGVTVPLNVTVRGAGKALTVLSFVDDVLPRQAATNKFIFGALRYEPIADPGNPPHPFLIHGEGHFTVEDLAIYAVNHEAGIESVPPVESAHAGHVTIRRVIMRLDRFVNVEHSNRHYLDDEAVFLKRWEKNRRTGAIELGGPNIQITECDIYSSLKVLMLNGCSGLIASNRFSAVPTHWTVFGRRTEKIIFEHNDCANGGVSMNSVHDMLSNDGKTRYPSIRSGNIYIARNLMRDSYRGDRDGGFNSDFHAPIGIYTGNITTNVGVTVTLPSAIAVPEFGTKWKGAIVAVLDGRGAGQYRYLAGGEDDTFRVDRPWDVPLDATSFICISKALDHVIAVDNDAHDTGNTVLFWSGGVDVIAARNRSVRGGAIQLTGICYDGQVLPGLRAQFFDNEITEGISWGASFIYPRGSFIGVITYPPLYYDRTWQADRGKAVTAPDYHGPLALDQVFRRNKILNNGRFLVGGNVANVLFEQGAVADADMGVEVAKKGGRWSDTLEGGPSDILIRSNRMHNVVTPYGGERLSAARVLK